MTMELSKVIVNRLRDMIAYKNEMNNIEVECRYTQPLSKPQFQKVLQYFVSTLTEPLKTHEETLDIITKNMRLTISGTQNIQKYCTTGVVTDFKSCITKNSIKNFMPVFIDSLNFKVDIKEELPIKPNVNEILIAPKMFRFKKRYSIVDKEYGVRYDMTVIKTSTSNTHINFMESNTVTNPEKYEFEIECISNKAGDPYALIKPMIEAFMVLSGTDIVINKSKIIKQYLDLTSQNDVKTHFVTKKPKKYLVGPKPISLELKNISQPPILGTPNIWNDYTVTEKTDGERHIMFVDNDGFVFLFNSRFDLVSLQFKINSFTNTLLDGEWIADKKLYALFDAYFVNGKDVMNQPLVGGRLDVLHNFHVRTHKSFEEAGCTLYLKEFYDVTTGVGKLWQKNISGQFPYKIDGLIFTPANLSVGSMYIEDQMTAFGTWKATFKWKPSHENTIDFLVKYDRDDTGKPKIVLKKKQVFNVASLYVGYQPAQWEKITAYDFLTGNLLPQNNYMARKFIPPDYVGSEDIATILVDPSIIEDDTIAEFSWNGEKWSYLRIREDKTELFRRNGLTDTANDWGTALNVWRSIKYPITIDMLTGQKDVTPADVPDENIYYSRTSSRDKFASRPMMDFHNEGVKNKSLISKMTGRLLDLACGKGGDINKWMNASIKDVVGFDYVADNIENPVDGAYARLSQKKDLDQTYKYVFLPMDCSKPLHPDQAYNDADKQLAEVLWGLTKDDRLSKYYGMMQESFDTISCQFAIHYFFKDQPSLAAFLNNVDKFIKVGGRFIGTCLNGTKIRKALKDKDNLTGKKGDRIIWDIRKKYQGKSPYGSEIDIYMESIGKVITEYLVDLNLLESLMNNMGYKTVFIKGFDMIYDEIMGELEGHYLQSISSMSDDEKLYSFMNIAFCFEKTSDKQLVEKKKVVVKKTEEVKEPKKRISLKKVSVPDEYVSPTEEPPKKLSIRIKKT